MGLTPEEKIRRLDDETEIIHQASKRISKILKIKLNTVSAILTAKRKGFESFRQYQNNVARKKGFLNESEYSLFLYYKRQKTFSSLRDFKEREGLTSLVRYRTPFVFDNFPSQIDSPISSLLKKEEQKAYALLESLVCELPRDYRQIIVKRYYQGKTLQKTAEEMHKNSKQLIAQMEDKAVKLLYSLARQRGLDKIYLG